jgi:ABC-type sugar transport system substrate-binding protein
VAAGAVALLTACSGGGSTTDSSSPSASPSASSASAINVGVGEITPHNIDSVAVMIQSGPTYSDSASKWEGAQAAATEAGVTADVYWSNQDPATELSNFNTIINTGKYGGLVIQAVSPQMCKLIADNVVSAQIVVTAMSGPLCDDGTGVGEQLVAPGTIAYVDNNNLINGAETMFNGAAEMLGDGPQKVLQVWGSEGHTTVVAHQTAWKTFADAHPNWELLGTTFVADWTTPSAYAATQNLLQAHPDATVVFTPYIDITAGVANAIKDDDRSDQVSLFETSGGTDLSMSLMREGRLSGFVPTASFDSGYQAVTATAKALKTGSAPENRWIVLDGPFVTADTVDAYEADLKETESK